jgi:hypothetical protein
MGISSDVATAEDDEDIMVMMMDRLLFVFASRILFLSKHNEEEEAETAAVELVGAKARLVLESNKAEVVARKHCLETNMRARKSRVGE